jgi:hypothetical protein
MDELAKVLLQYGALGAIVIYFLWKDSKKLDKTNEILATIADIYEESISHERGRSKECYEELVARLDEHHGETMSEFQSVKHQIELKVKG